MSLYGLYLRNPSTDLIFLLHMERTYIGAVQRRVNFDFFIENGRNENSLKNVKFLIWTSNIHKFVRPVSPLPLKRI